MAVMALDGEMAVAAAAEVVAVVMGGAEMKIQMIPPLRRGLDR
jgi:hypothetical protein